MADETPPIVSAYDLLTKPTLELTDAEVAIIVEDLRKKRHAYVDRGKKDSPPKPTAATGDKAADTASIADLLGL